jgi:hypothetical protein
MLLDEPPQHADQGGYQRFKTHLCHPLTAPASPGFEPEPEAAAKYAITEVGWFNIQDETNWHEAIARDGLTAPALRRIRQTLN